MAVTTAGPADSRPRAKDLAPEPGVPPEGFPQPSAGATPKNRAALSLSRTGRGPQCCSFLRLCTFSTIDHRWRPGSGAGALPGWLSGARSAIRNPRFLQRPTAPKTGQNGPGEPNIKRLRSGADKARLTRMPAIRDFTDLQDHMAENQQVHRERFTMDLLILSLVAVL